MKKETGGVVRGFSGDQRGKALARFALIMPVLMAFSLAISGPWPIAPATSAPEIREFRRNKIS